MKILSFDTCLDKMYVAVGDENGIIDSKIVETTETTYHSAFLISTIASIVEANNLKLEEIDVIATNIGPGSFTGIRACTTVARVMAQGLDKKTVGVSSLEIISKINPTSKKTLVALDARKEMAYVAIYDNGVQIQAPSAILLTEIKEIIANDDYFVVTDNKLMPILGGVSYQESDYDLGKFLIEITSEKIKIGVETDWRRLLPLYIQPPALNLKKVK